MLSSKQLARVDALLDALLELPASARAQWLQQTCADDPEVGAEVSSLAQAAQSMGSFMETPPAAQSVETAEALIAPGSRIGSWRVIRLIGSGGMGEVYEVERAAGGFSQRAAVKVLRSAAASQLERFHAEREILARLEHPGIARLYDGGVLAGRPFMVMELVSGDTITDYCARTHASLALRLRLFMQICEAVAYAHRNLVVHRDLKPGNILVAEDGSVKLLDFGIAKILGDDLKAQTQTLAAPMTPGYAAPEQLTGEPVTTATDVYALGVLLFELLTGTRLRSATASIAESVRTIVDQSAPLASRTAATRADGSVPPRVLRGDLDAIIAKSLRREPSQRYAAVESLRADIERFLAGEPVTARAGARLYIFGRVLRRYRWQAAAIGAVFAALAVGLGTAALQAHRADIERDTARRDLAREEALRYYLTGMFRKSADAHGTSPSAKSMLDESAQRVLREYRDQPELAGRVVVTLADLYQSLEDVEGAATLLQGYLSEAGPKSDPVALADARQKMANIEFLRGNLGQAEQLLSAAESFWAHSPDRYAEEQLEGLGIRARLQRAHGDLAGAILTSQEAIKQRIAVSGRNNRETALLYNSLAISLTAANRLDEALGAYHETTAIYQALGLGEGLDAQIVLGNTGTLLFRTGQLREAEPLLQRAVERERALAGDSAAVAAALGYDGKLLSIRERNDESLRVLGEAVELGSRFAGKTSPLTLQNRLFLGEAQLGEGDRASARATLEEVRRDVLEKLGPSNPLALRCAIGLAQVLAAEGRLDGARSDLASAITALRALGPRGQVTLAEALVASGDAALKQGDSRAAVGAASEALELYGKGREHSWEVGLARERLGEALAAQHDRRAREMLEQAAAMLEEQLGSEHSEVRRARMALGQLSL